MKTKDQQNLISVIVPIYNAELFLSRCVESILNQTYNNIEVILVNDGSTDKSSNICNDLAASDKRVKVVHKRNGGVSSARNVGLYNARGCYISFVDADDYIDGRMLESLAEGIKNNKVDVALCNIQEVPNGSFVEHSNDDDPIFSILSREQALDSLLYQRQIINGVHGKLYKKELFDSVTFSEDTAIGEDLEVNYKVFLISKEIAVSSSKLYMYVQSDNSAMRSIFASKRLQGLKVTVGILDSIIPNVKLAAKNRVFSEALNIAVEMPTQYIKKNPLQFYECRVILRKYSFDITFDKNASFNIRLYAALIGIFSTIPIIALLKLKRMIKLKG